MIFFTSGMGIGWIGSSGIFGGLILAIGLDQLGGSSLASNQRRKVLRAA